MAATRTRRRGGDSVSYWPGFVDALARHMAFLQQRDLAVDRGLRECECCFGFRHHGIGRLQLRLQTARVEDGERIAGIDTVTNIGANGRDPAAAWKTKLARPAG